MLWIGWDDALREDQGQQGKKTDRDNHRINYRLIFFIFGKPSYPQTDEGHRPGEKIGSVKNRIGKPGAEEQAPGELKKGMGKKAYDESSRAGFKPVKKIENQTEQIKADSDGEGIVEDQGNHW